MTASAGDPHLIPLGIFFFQFLPFRNERLVARRKDIWLIPLKRDITNRKTIATQNIKYSNILFWKTFNCLAQYIQPKPCGFLS